MSEETRGTIGPTRAPAAARAAEAMLRTVGGGTVTVRVPLAITSSDANSQLGLSGTAVEDVALSPVVVRKYVDSGNKLHRELLIAAGTLTRAREIRDADAAELFFRTAASLLVEGKQMSVAGFSADQFAGAPYLYRVEVSE